MKEKHKANRTT